MQKLHLVGFTTDRDGLILSTRKGAKTGAYVIGLDEKLLESITDAQLRRNGGPEIAEASDPSGGGARRARVEAAKPARPVSSLSPREIQARLRAGGTIDEIATAAGVDQEWVLRFADPIRAEQARVVERALRLVFVKPRLGPSVQPLGPSVRWNLSDKGIQFSDDVFDLGWTAYNLHGTTWAVRFAYRYRARNYAAVWQVDLRLGEVVARGRQASELGYVEPGRKPARLEPLEQPATKDTMGPAARPTATTTATNAAPRPPARPATKAAAKPAPKEASTKAPSKATKVAASETERPTHLARPPSPMNSTNRAPSGAGRMASAPSLRPSGRPVGRAPQAPPVSVSRPASPPKPGPAGQDETARQPAAPNSQKALPKAGPRSEAFTPGPPPAKLSAVVRRPGRSAPARPVPTIPPMAVPPVIEVGPGQPEPAVVVRPAKSTRATAPAVRQTKRAPEPPAVKIDPPKGRAARRGR